MSHYLFFVFTSFLVDIDSRYWYTDIPSGWVPLSSGQHNEISNGSRIITNQDCFARWEADELEGQEGRDEEEVTGEGADDNATDADVDAGDDGKEEETVGTGKKGWEDSSSEWTVKL